MVDWTTQDREADEVSFTIVVHHNIGSIARGQYNTLGSYNFKSFGCVAFLLDISTKKGLERCLALTMNAKWRPRYPQHIVEMKIAFSCERYYEFVRLLRFDCFSNLQTSK
jgi:hypothetical protein